MKFSRKRKDTLTIVRIPLVAFIDVVLFLLLYFVMASEIASAGEGQLSSTLSTDKKAASTNLQAQILRVEPAPEGVAFIIGQRRATSADDLLGILKILPKDAGVLVRVKGDVPIEHAAAAVQACRDAGFVKVSYVPSTQ
ncbi:MAG TPA: biopolymer transporter ExbD [Phycisphaerales bacterium]|nr:biopolymer transporter ExbD [Phycisphaerales bacterium]